MIDTKPEALRLAEMIEDDMSCISDDEIAKELRRLHEVNESLLAANKDSTNHFDALMADHKKLHEVNQELLEALKAMVKDFDGCYAEGEPAMIKAQAAIAKAEGSV
jgi:hypothetical protein